MTGVEVVAGDVLAPDSLGAATQGVEVAYYLVHSMGSTHGLEEDDRKAARNFGSAARGAGVRRITISADSVTTGREASRSRLISGAARRSEGSSGNPACR